MAKRPLSPLLLGSLWGGADRFTFSKSERPNRAIQTDTTFIDRNLSWTGDEVRAIYAWLGKVIADLDQGV